MIRAECHSDDHVIEVEFDATPWFEQATDQEILNLKGCDFGGDYPADEVAMWTADFADPALCRVFQYLELVAYKKDRPGFECHVDEDAALVWIKKNRSQLLP